MWNITFFSWEQGKYEWKPLIQRLTVMLKGYKYSNKYKNVNVTSTTYQDKEIYAGNVLEK